MVRFVPESPTSQTMMGAETRHESAEKHVSGEALYIDDLPAPANTLHAYVGLSSIAHGRLERLDLSKVSSCPGVVCVLTAQDIPGVNDTGPVFPGDPVLVEKEIDFWGQVLFAVAASSQAVARKAARPGFRGGV